MKELEIAVRNIKNRMIETNKTSAEVIRAANGKFSDAFFYMLLRGNANDVMLNKLAYVSDAIGVSLAWLLTNHQENTTESESMTLEEFEDARLLNVKDQTHKLDKLFYQYEKNGNEEAIKINGIDIPSNSVLDIDVKECTASIIIPLDEIHIKK